jgi:plasmid stability protein
MSFESLPEDLRQKVRLFADAHRVSVDEAHRRLIESGLRLVEVAEFEAKGSTRQKARTGQDRVSIEAIVTWARSGVNKRLEGQTEANDLPRVLGAFTNVPGFVESIEAVTAERPARYGFPE